jgi:hypothetical protein
MIQNCLDLVACLGGIVDTWFFDHAHHKGTIVELRRILALHHAGNVADCRQLSVGDLHRLLVAVQQVQAQR